MAVGLKLPLSSPPRAICVLRLSAIGDTCHTLPVVRSLQAAWPETSITWIIGRTEAGLLGDIPDLEFITFDKRSGLAGMRQIWRTLRRRRFDVLLHMQAALRASLLSLGLRADVRLGFDRPRARDFQWLFTNTRIPAHPRQHVMDGLFGFAEALGVTRRVLRWDIPVPPEAEAFARGHIPEDAPALVISPCSSQRARNYRNWRPEHYAAVVDHAWREHGLRSILTGGGTGVERDYAARISELARHKPLDLVGRTSLKQLFALLGRAAAVLCPDSGPAHMATAAGTPVIGLYATSNPQRTGPYFSREWTVNKYPEALAREGLSLERVRWGQRVRNPDAMDLIRPENVYEKLALLPRRASGRPGTTEKSS